jgi:propionyl-CoA carboxylase alpha chain
VIEKLLIANRGEIACRIARSARAMGIATVGVFSDADRDALHVSAVDEAVRLPGNSAAETYLRIDEIIEGARRTGADAVHPGYGFLSERASFARACADADLTFVGPPPRAIELMGSKIEAKGMMAAAGVPVLASCDARALDQATAEIGFPMLVKAAFGGGGRGMRIVRDVSELPAAVAAAQREAVSAFGDGTVFLERYLERPRHIEVQVLGDAYGNVVHLFERDCSIQRRHQKLIEESPAPNLDPAVRDEICRHAVAAAKTIGYVNAGTVEFVVDTEGQFFFLEVNTRLQVEHPVTEMVTGLDLVELQLRIAQGEALPAAVLDARTDGHALEARLYAEDAVAGYLPVSGRIERMQIPTDTHVRVDAGYRDGSLVSAHYDAMLAKVIAWAPTRAEAARRLSSALRTAELHGLVTNRDMLAGVLEHPEFLAGRVDTGFLDRHPPATLVPPIDATMVRRHAVEAARADRDIRRTALPVPTGIPAGWRNVGPADQPVTFVCGPVEVTIEMRDLDASDEVTLNCVVHRVGQIVYVDSALGSTPLHEQPRFPSTAPTEAAGSLRAPMPGVITRLAVRVGEEVVAGDVLVAMEAMKMEHTLVAPRPGRVREVRVSVGDQVDSGMVLVVIDADE